ncbi:MAG: CHAT domain-containing protein, partial [Chloroflexota bacterium]
MATITITFTPHSSEHISLRYHVDPPITHETPERLLPLADVTALMAEAEQRYYAGTSLGHTVVRRSAMTGDDALMRMGQQLYQWLDGEDRWLSGLLDGLRTASGTGAGRSEGNVAGTSPVVLAINSSEHVSQGTSVVYPSHLPWELLHDGSSPTVHGYLVGRVHQPVIPVRVQQPSPSLPQSSGGPTPTSDERLRLLFMASSPLDSKPVLDYEREEALILTATERLALDLYVEESGNLAELGWLVQSWGSDQETYFDVFHLTGHADIRAEGPRFLTEDLEGRSVWVDAQALRTAWPRPPRLVFLSGCRTGEARASAGSSRENTGQNNGQNNGQNITGGVPSLAESLVTLGVPMVLGWGRPVLDPEATRTAATLYEGLAAGQSPLYALHSTYRALLGLEDDAQGVQPSYQSWHLLRLYANHAQDLTTPLVRPHQQQNRRPHRGKRGAEMDFLDAENRVRVAGRREFVGRRRLLQQALQVLRKGKDEIDDPKVGIVLHGMGGLGKSSVAARLADRLAVQANMKRVVLFGHIDEARLLQKLAPVLGSDEYHLVQRLNASEQEAGPLSMRLRSVFEQTKHTFLLILDDFEQNFERQAGSLLMRNGHPILTPQAASLLRTLLNALYDAEREHALIITSRYAIQLDSARWLHAMPLTQFDAEEVRKKMVRLRADGTTVEAFANDRRRQRAGEETLIPRATQLADGNPRLLEWLLRVLADTVAGLDHAALLDALAAKTAEFREDILAAHLLSHQPADLQQMLAHLLICQLPVPMPVVVTVTAALDIARTPLRQHLDRAVNLGLLERHDDALGEAHLRVPRILEPLLAEVEQATDEVALAKVAAEKLYTLWWQGDEGADESQMLEMIRLARLGQVREITVTLANSITAAWNRQQRYRETRVLLTGTLAEIGEDVDLLERLAMAQNTLGDKQACLKNFQRVLALLAADDQKNRARLLTNIGAVYDALGEKQKALGYYEDALPLRRAVGDRGGEAT